MRQSFTWWSFKDRGLTDRELLTAAAEIGYQGVEFLPVELWPVAQERGLAIATMAGHGTIAEGFNRRENHGRIRDELRRNLDLAVKHGVPTLIGFAGNRQPGVSDADAIDHAAEGLAKAAPLLEQANVDLVIELLNSKITHKGYQADHTAWGVSLCRAVKSPRVKLLYDIYHMQVMEGDLIATVRAGAGHIGHYHTAGVPGRGELDETQEINYPGVFAAIKATGYTGYIGHEFIPTRDLKRGLKQAFDLVKSV